jgi:hypothetical protein
MTAVATPDALFLSLATAIATITAAAVALGLLRPHGRGEQLASVAVIHAAVLGITAGLLAVARRHPSGALNVVIALGILAPGLYVVTQAISEIVKPPLRPGEDDSPDRVARRAHVAIGVSSVGVAIGLLFALTTPGLIDSIVTPKQPRSSSGYSPSTRPVFSCLANKDCPGPPYVAFNSYRNTPSYGDERSFVDARRASDTKTKSYRDVLNVSEGQEIVVRIYVDNNADARQAVRRQETVSQNARLLVLSDLNEKKRLIVAASITADNAIPRTVSDTVELLSNHPIAADYIEGSARIFNGAQGPTGSSLSDDVYADGKKRTRGALLGFARMDGRIAGEFKQASVVELKFSIR